MRALLERLRSPARKASSDAGPPDRWVLAGFGLAVLITAIGWFSGVLRDVPWPLWAVIPVAILTVVGFADRDGVQVAAIARLRGHLRALETGTIDMAPILTAAEGLNEEERRYQLTAAAWAQAWLDIDAHRPWRERFGTAVRGLGPHPVPGRFLAVIGMQQLVAPIATILATAIIGVAFGW